MPNYRWECIRYNTYGLVSVSGEIVATIYGRAYTWHYKDKEYVDKKSAQRAAENALGVTL